MTQERRDQGTSSYVWNDRDSRYHAYVSMGTRADGRRDRRHVTSYAVNVGGLTAAKLKDEKRKAKKDVAEKVKELEQLRDAGVKLDSKPPTVAEWLRTYLDSTARRTVAKSTWIRYDSLARIHIIPKLGSHRLHKLTPEHVEAFYAELEQKLSGSSALQTHRLLSRCLKVAMQRRKIDRNVCTLVDAPSNKTKKKARPLDKAEASRVFEAVDSMEERNGVRWFLAVLLGLRMGEVLGLRWSCVDLHAGVVRINRSLQRIKGEGLVLGPVKSNAGKRALPLDAALIARMKAHRKQQLADKLAAGSDWENADDLVFVQINGRPIDPKQHWIRWNELLDAAKAARRGTHAARRTAASVMARTGVHVAEAKTVLGHSQVSLTIDEYTEVDTEQSRGALAAISAYLLAANDPTEDASTV